MNAAQLNLVICEACAPATPVNEQTVSSGSRGAAAASRPRVNIDQRRRYNQAVATGEGDRKRGLAFEARGYERLAAVWGGSRWVEVIEAKSRQSRLAPPASKTPAAEAAAAAAAPPSPAKNGCFPRVCPGLLSSLSALFQMTAK